MVRRSRAGIAALGVLILSVAAAAPAAALGLPLGPKVGTALTTKTPYPPQAGPSSYRSPPVGYQAVFTENVSRHGARTLSDSSDGDAIVALWSRAKAQGGLTKLGAGLGPEVQRLLAANAADGYGLLTDSGKQSLRQTAERMEQRLPGVFAAAARRPGTSSRIEVLSSSQPRAIQSANEFVAGLEQLRPGLAATISPDKPDDNLLYFHKAKINADYQSYVKNDPRVASAEATVRNDPRTAAAARLLLERSFTPSFVARLAAGDDSAEFPDAIAAAEAVYNLWAVTKDMPDEGPWHLDRYLSPAEESWFGYLDDVTSFYENGPAFSGSDITYRMAGVLLTDMFGQLDAIRSGTSDAAAVLRFTHAEEIFPLATLLGLPGSTKQLPGGTLFTYQDDPFRGATVAPMGANIQWDLFRRGSTYLVRMLYNEKPTAFKAGCTPVSRGSQFYELSTLERCYAMT